MFAKRSLVTVLVFLGIQSLGASGPITSGGGNLYRGRPLEDYIQNPETLAAYKNILQQIQSKLSGTAYFMNDMFNYTLLHKTWYFVPGPLAQLPPGKIDSVVGTDQVALQGFENVWLDRDLFAKMSIDDQADLLLHEVFMGMKLLRFESLREQCLAIITDPGSSYQCDPQHKIRHGTAANLTPLDYEQIRKTVTDVRSLPEKLTPQDYQNLSELFALRDFSDSFEPFPRKGDTTFISMTDFIQGLNTAYLSNSWPSHLFRFSDFLNLHPGLQGDQIKDGMVWNAQGGCRLDPFKLVNGHLVSRYVSQPLTATGRDVNLDFDTSAGGSILTQKDFENPLDPTQQTFGGFNTTISRANSGRITVGDHFLSTTFLLGPNGIGMDGVHVKEFVITEVGDPNDMKRGDGFNEVVGGINEICSLRQTIILNP